MMRLIPIQATRNQDRTVQLGGINYGLHIFQNTEGVFMTVSQAGNVIVASALCRDRVRIIRDAYLGFNGDLTFFDTQGTNDPQWQEFGTRYVLAWLEPGEVTA